MLYHLYRHQPTGLIKTRRGPHQSITGEIVMDGISWQHERSNVERRAIICRLVQNGIIFNLPSTVSTATSQKKKKGVRLMTTTETRWYAGSSRTAPAQLHANKMANNGWSSSAETMSPVVSQTATQREAKLVDTSPTHWHVNPQTSPLLGHFLCALFAGLHHRASHVFSLKPKKQSIMRHFLQTAASYRDRSSSASASTFASADWSALLRQQHWSSTASSTRKWARRRAEAGQSCYWRGCVFTGVVSNLVPPTNWCPPSLTGFRRSCARVCLKWGVITATSLSAPRGSTGRRVRVRGGTQPETRVSSQHQAASRVSGCLANRCQCDSDFNRWKNEHNNRS